MSEIEAPCPPGGGDLAPRTVGDMLREGRARMNLSAADVARHLRLSLRQVEALEANDFAALPGRTIIRGFIRNYARLLQMDPDPLLAAYEAAQPVEGAAAIAPKAERIELAPRRFPRWLIPAGVLLVLVVGLPLALYGLLKDDAAVRPAPSAPSAPLQGTAAQDRIDLPLPAAAPLAPPPAEATQTVEEGSAAPPEGVQAEGPPAAAGRLHFVFDEDAWVEVRDRQGRPIFSKLNRKGSEETLNAEGPLTLVIGNAHHVRLTYNGKPVDLAPHVKVNVARLTLE